MKTKKKKGAKSGASAAPKVPAARLAELEGEALLLQEEVAMLREEWHQEVAFLQGKLAESERARQELAAWIASADHHENPEDPHVAWMDQLEHDIQSTQEEVHRIGARVWALRQVSARLQRERQLLESRIADTRTGTERVAAAERRRITAELTRHSNSLRGTRRDAGDDLRLLRTDLAALLGSSARLTGEIDRARAATAGGPDSPTRVPIELVDRVQVASVRAAELAGECERLNQQVSALDSEISVAVPRLVGSPRTEAEDVETPPPPAPDTAEPPPPEKKSIRDAFPIKPSEDITLGFRLREQMQRQRAHLKHWEKIRREMAAESHAAPVDTPAAPAVAQAEEASLPVDTPAPPLAGEPPSDTAPATSTSETADANLSHDDTSPADEVPAPDEMPRSDDLTTDEMLPSGEFFPEVVAPTEAPAFQPAEIFVLDDGEVGVQAARRLHEFGFTVSLRTSATELGDEIANRRIVSAAVNLAMPNAWGAVRRLRSLYRRPGTRLYAYAMGPDAATGAWLGPIDLFFLSSGEETVLGQLRELEPVLRRVLLTTADPDSIDHIQRELSRAQVATRTVSDLRECEASLKEFAPQLGIVHLSPRCFEAFPIMAMLRANLSTRDIPLLFLLDAAAHPRDVAFFSAGLRTLAERGALDTTKLVNHLSLNLKVTARFLH